MSYRHFALGALAIFLYMGIEVGVPNFVQQYLVADGIPAATVGLLVAVYWFMMLIGRLVGAGIGSAVSSRAMIVTVSTATIVLVLFGMFAPTDVLVSFPGVDWGKLELIWQPIPVGIFSFLLVGLCTSVMWGSIFNMAVEGLGKFTAIASGIFMTMVFGCAVMMAIQGAVADATNYITSFWVVVFCAAYILFYALVGSKPAKK
jgi:FHS family L-fucose permease-like MFS transporter